MRDPQHPTADEIRRWARGEGKTPGYPGWMHTLATIEVASLLCDLATDPSIKRHDEVLNCLYTLTANVVLQPPTARKKRDIRRLLDVISDVEAPTDVMTWVERSRHVLEHPETCDYRFWIGGGHRHADNPGAT